ncbi:unnamed protein product [Microthlaspi erraticum]|uniref:NB-ARC domain-containing protein n=1 Tax=Microthlaspi erraticum TaxID=1685480 RepID=A0A6D2HKB8_9BRAS|nr:unnamed protein product [Microthlaspi erraticum]
MAFNIGLTSRSRFDFTVRFAKKSFLFSTKVFAEKFHKWECTKDTETTERDEEDRVETNSSLPGNEIHGFKNEIESLKNFLLDQKVYDEFKSLVVVGEYGVGKTALCKTIFNDDEVKSVYAPRIWISMHSKKSKEGLDKKIYVMKKILKVLLLEDDLLKSFRIEASEEARAKLEAGESDGDTAKEKELSDLLYALHLNLRWKKYLVVFDDVREEDNWNEMLQDDEFKLNKDKQWGKHLSGGFPKGSGGRVIYTTRDVRMAMKLVAEEHEIHRLWPLSDPESVWKIYKAVIEKIYTEIPRNNKKCIEELMNKSRGLPLAVRSMATLNPVFIDDFQNPRLSESTSPEDDKLPSTSS